MRKIIRGNGWWIVVEEESGQVLGGVDKDGDYPIVPGLHIVIPEYPVTDITELVIVDE